MSFLWKVILVGMVFVLLAGCEPKEDGKPIDNNHGNTGNTGSDNQNTDGDGTEDTGFDQDTSHSTDTNSGVIVPDCGGCTGVGDDLEAMRCAVDLCDASVVISQDYTSPTTPNKKILIAETRSAINRFGDPNNGLAPLLNDSYVLMGTGRIPYTTVHNDQIGAGSSLEDGFAADKTARIFDVMEWRLRLKAPKNAGGFQIHYVFFSTEYDEYIGDKYNDKFYIFIEAPSTDGGTRTVINFTECREPGGYSDFVCNSGMDACNVGERYCYIAINTALSECCWYDECSDGIWTTNISGTGFSCGGKYQDITGDGGHIYGSSTGWLATEWPVEPGEEFDLVFHIHDTGDAKRDSAVLLDKFLFVGKANPGTTPI